MSSLDVLQRLAGQAVDQERQRLQTIGTEIADVENEIDDVNRMIVQETSAPLDFMTSGATLAAFIQAKNARLQDLKERLRGLREAYDAQIGRVREMRVEEKRYELLAERRATQMALEMAAKEQKTIDELVAIGHARTRDDPGQG